MRRVLLALTVFVAIAPAGARTRAVRVDQPRILWIGAHPDDESLIAPLFGRECAEGGASCTILVFTRGERGDCALAGGCGDLGATRAVEMQRAAAMLHASLTQWTLGDVMSDVETTWEAEVGGRNTLLDRIAATIIAERPTVVITFDPIHGSTCHPAHRAVARLVSQALGRITARPALSFVETTAAFEGGAFVFGSAVASALTVDATNLWSYLVRDADIHASQFSPAVLESLRNTTAEQQRMFLLASSEVAGATYLAHCP